MDLSNKKILVTGASGFIGSHLTESLAQISDHVSIFLHYRSSSDRGWIDTLPKDIQSRLQVFWGDLKDAESIRRAVKGQDVVFNLAAQIAVPYSFVNPSDVIHTNAIGSMNIFDACREYNVQKVVQTSTSETYGTAITVPISESHPSQAQSPYAASKIAADKIAESYVLALGAPIAILRPFNTYGPRQSARAVIPTIITQALTQPTIKLGSLDPKRDLLFVLDTVAGFKACAETDATIGQVTNVGTGQEVSIGDLVTTIQKILGTNKEVVTDTTRIRPGKSEVQRLLCDYSKATQLMNWKPQHTLEQGLAITIDWIQKNLQYYRPEIYNI